MVAKQDPIVCTLNFRFRVFRFIKDRGVCGLIEGDLHAPLCQKTMHDRLLVGTCFLLCTVVALLCFAPLHSQTCPHGTLFAELVDTISRLTKMSCLRVEHRCASARLCRRAVVLFGIGSLC